MDWFDRLVANRYIEVALVTNNQGQLLRSSRAFGRDDEMLPSMLQALEMLAQTLTTELGCGAAHMVQLSTEQGHLLLFPVLQSAYYVVVMVEKTAPLMLVIIGVERALRDLTEDDFTIFDDAPELNADELIEAVREWLHRPNKNKN